MSKIKVLDSFVFNRIAAGEVVERPCSAVKELVENSIDAGATSIIVSIEKGGLKKIEITDNGCGIDFEDLKTAFIPHATSKISTIDDLDEISTLGFRGEALASIASVSEVEIISKTKDCEFGGKIRCVNGKIEEPTQIGTIDGTRIKVSNLFTNIPARLKFMRKDKTEENDITNYIARLILANPSINFTYIADGKTIYKYTSSDLKNAILDIYGYDIEDNLLEVKERRDQLIVSGFIGRPELAKSNKTHQTLIINGRYVVNNVVASAIHNVYSDYLLKGKYPFYVLNLEIPLDKVDVNVHPSKLEVKFQNSNEVFSLFNSACFHALNRTNFTTSPIIEQPKQDELVDEKIVGANKIPFKLNEGQSYRAEREENASEEFSPKSLEFASKTSLLGEIILTKDPLPKTESSKQVAFKQDILFEVKQDAKHLCTLFDTYLLLQKGNDVFLIDQHAAHERLIYDKLQENIENSQKSSQKLLFPYSLVVSLQEDNFMQDNLSTFEDIGFSISEFGKCTYKVDSVPSILSGINLKDYFDDILKDLNTVINKPLGFIKDSICQKACKSAVKGGDKLSDIEVKKLLEELEEKNTTLLCPHGRPIVVKLTKTDIEKWFKRIV